MGKGPREIIVKTLVTTKDNRTSFDFFTNLQNWESGGSLKNIKKNQDNWWSAESPFGNIKIKLRDNKKFGIFDHDFNVGDMNRSSILRLGL